MRKAIVMAGGDESRLWPLTQSRPRSLIPVVNRPLIAHILEWLRHSGFTEVLVTLSRHADDVRHALGDGHSYGLHLTYQGEDGPRGAAGSVKLAEEWIDGESFLVAGGDALTDVDLAALQRQHWETGAWLTLGLHRGRCQSPQGSVDLDDRGAVIRFHDKPHRHHAGSALVNTGIYCVEPQVLERVPGAQAYDWIHDLLPQILSEGLPVYGCEVEGYWRHIGNFADYRRGQRETLEGVVEVRIPARHLHSGVWIGDDVEIAPNVVVEGPVLIGSGSHVGPEALILPGTVLGERCVVGAGACLWGATLGAGCRVAPDAMLRDCVVDAGVQIGVAVSITEGAVVGSGCRLGAGVRVHAGQRLEPGQVLHAERHEAYSHPRRTRTPAEWVSASSSPVSGERRPDPMPDSPARASHSPVWTDGQAEEVAGEGVLTAGGRH